jgi:hypothetical protein
MIQVDLQVYVGNKLVNAADIVLPNEATSKLILLEDSVKGVFGFTDLAAKASSVKIGDLLSATIQNVCFEAIIESANRNSFSAAAFEYPDTFTFEIEGDILFFTSAHAGNGVFNKRELFAKFLVAGIDYIRFLKKLNTVQQNGEARHLEVLAAEALRIFESYYKEEFDKYHLSYTL